MTAKYWSEKTTVTNKPSLFTKICTTVGASGTTTSVQRRRKNQSVLSRWRYSPTVCPLNLSFCQLMEATLSPPAFERICPAVSLNLAPHGLLSVRQCVSLCNPLSQDYLSGFVWYFFLFYGMPFGRHSSKRRRDTWERSVSLCRC